MLPLEIIVAIVVVLGAVVGYVVWSRRRALPPAGPSVRPSLRSGAGGEREKPPVEPPPGEGEPPVKPPPDERRKPPIEPPPDERGPPVKPPPGEDEPPMRVQPRVPPPPSISSVPLPVDKPSPSTREPQRGAQRQKERDRYQRGLAKTRGGFVAKLARILRGKPKVDAALRDQVEEVIFTADIGTQTAQKLLDRVTTVLDSKEIADADAVWSVIREASLEIVQIPTEPLDFEPSLQPYVLLMIGVNGVGKTTTLGKLGARHVEAGRKVLLVAGDTFRAAAVEQLDVWARRVGCDLHAGADKADPSSVIFDGITRARREGYDVVLCDTAGRLHTRKELMDELAKVRRAATKAVAQTLPQTERDRVTGPHDTFLVLDATIGQNALQQAKMFKDTMDFTGLVITKLDGTAKGGVVLGICDEMRIPIRYIGIGEGVDDLRGFDAEDFVDALYSDRDSVAEGAA